MDLLPGKFAQDGSEEHRHLEASSLERLSSELQKALQSKSVSDTRAKEKIYNIACITYVRDCKNSIELDLVVLKM